MELKDLLEQYLRLGDRFADEWPGPFLLQKGLPKAEVGTRTVFHLDPTKGPVRLGRGSDAPLRIPKRDISSKHAEFLPPKGRRGGGWQIVDLGSTNGTFIGGQPLTPHDPVPLEDRDQLRFGPSDSYAFLLLPSMGRLLEQIGGAVREREKSRPPPAPKRSAPAPTRRPAPEPARAAMREPARSLPPPAPIEPQRGEPATDLPRDFVPRLLAEAREQRASDLHLVVGMAPVFRVNGKLVRRSDPILGPDDAEALVWQATTEEQRDRFFQTGDLDTCSVVSDLRYRLNVCRTRVGCSLTFRVISQQVPTLEELGIPAAAEELTKYAQGLVLITGPLGAGKTTTMFSLVDTVNRSRKENIITIEDPVEFLLPPRECQVCQRELGTHTASFGAALRGALREDPDIIVIGDLRDYETAKLAISAAETGHLVFASMATMNATKTIDKLIDLFPAGEQANTRTVFSESLRGILCQHLLPGKGGQRVAAVELVFNSIAVANIIREGKTSALQNAMQMGRSQGMRSLQFSLHELVGAGAISPETALAAESR